MLRRRPGYAEPEPEDLRALIQVTDLGALGEPGYDTQVLLGDAVRDFAEVADDLEAALARQPGIDAAEGLDREIWILRTRLSLADVAAATARALFDLNRAGSRPPGR